MGPFINVQLYYVNGTKALLKIFHIFLALERSAPVLVSNIASSIICSAVLYVLKKLKLDVSSDVIPAVPVKRRFHILCPNAILLNPES